MRGSRSCCSTTVKDDTVMRCGSSRSCSGGIRAIGCCGSRQARPRCAADAAEAESQLDAGLRMLASDERERMFGEEALWYGKRGAARVALRRLDQADVDLRRAVGASQSRTWVKGRAYAELGKIADLRRDRAAARANFEKAVMLCEEDNDPLGADAARQWIDRPYQ
jgi:hypothetical protein